ncbi:MAG: hypothetical protein AAFW87_01525 [Pseudomonadota bacterium]
MTKLSDKSTPSAMPTGTMKIFERSTNSSVSFLVAKTGTQTQRPFFTKTDQPRNHYKTFSKDRLRLSGRLIVFSFFDACHVVETHHALSRSNCEISQIAQCSGWYLPQKTCGSTPKVWTSASKVSNHGHCSLSRVTTRLSITGARQPGAAFFLREEDISNACATGKREAAYDKNGQFHPNTPIRFVDSAAGCPIRCNAASPFV